MAKTQKNIAAAVTNIAAPIALSMGYDIWDVEYVKEGADYYLRITIDKEDGIDINDCETFHHAIDEPLDLADPISDSYHLEISSPGIEREIRTPAHIAACIGENVCAKLFQPHNGTKTLIGTLKSYNEATNEVILSIADSDITISRADISKMNVYYDFNT